MRNIFQLSHILLIILALYTSSSVFGNIGRILGIPTNQEVSRRPILLSLTTTGDSSDGFSGNFPGFLLGLPFGIEEGWDLTNHVDTKPYLRLWSLLTKNIDLRGKFKAERPFSNGTSQTTPLMTMTILVMVTLMMPMMIKMMMKTTTTTTTTTTKTTTKTKTTTTTTIISSIITPTTMTTVTTTQTEPEVVGDRRNGRGTSKYGILYK